MKLSTNNLAKIDSGLRLACRTNAKFGLNCWIMITPFKIDPETGMSTLNAPGVPWQFRVRHFGIEASFDFDKYDLDPEHVTNFLNKVVDSIAEVEQLISPIVSNSDSLVEPRDCGCPI